MLLSACSLTEKAENRTTMATPAHPSLANLALVLVLLFAEGEEPPTPAERIAALRKDCAEKRVKLAGWAKGKKLLTEARSQYLIAIHLDPDHSRARSRLGHRKHKDGTWNRKREKSVKDGAGARDKYGEELAGREAELCREEAAAFAVLGEALVSEGHEDLGRPLLLRAYFLDPRNTRAAKGIGLVPVREGFGTPEEARVLRDAPTAKKAGFQGALSKAIGIATDVKAAGSASSEGAKGIQGLGETARLADQAQRLTSLRFGLPLQGEGWIRLITVPGQENFNAFVDSLKLDEKWAAVSKQIGSVRLGRFRHGIAAWTPPGSSAKSLARLFLAVTAEDQLYWHGGEKVPAWLTETVGNDTCLVLLGRPGPGGVTVESSTGLSTQAALEKPEAWPALLLKRAATGRICRFEHMVTAKYTGLGREDVVTGVSFYRYLLLTKREELGKYLLAFMEEPDSAKNFAAAFGMGPEEVTTALRTVLLGAPPIVPLERPAGK